WTMFEGADVDAHAGFDLSTHRLEHGVESFGLRNRTNNAVENGASRILRLSELLSDNSENHRVRHEVAPIHERLCLEPKGCSGSDRASQHVARGKRRHL